VEKKKPGKRKDLQTSKPLNEEHLLGECLVQEKTEPQPERKKEKIQKKERREKGNQFSWASFAKPKKGSARNVRGGNTVKRPSRAWRHRSSNRVAEGKRLLRQNRGVHFETETERGGKPRNGGRGNPR